ncbi:TlpA family protein disulfide reductase [Mucilaginibacter phyllosphaerae]
MKPIISFLAALCLFLNVTAQEKNNKNILPLPTGIQIGQAVPDVFVTGVSGLNIKGKPVTQFQLSELRGKLVVLDFWATWCSPCRNMVPVIDSLRKVFGEKVLFLSVTYQNAATVAPVLAQLQKIKPFQLPEVTSDTVLHQLFPHRSLPHFVWISHDGIVKAITEEKEVTGENIRKLLRNNTAAAKLEEKKDIRTDYNAEAPLFLAGNGGDGGNVVFHSMLSGYIPGIGSGTRRTEPDPVNGQIFTARNSTLPWLCRMAYGDHGWFQNAQVRVLTKDSLQMTSKLRGQDAEKWLEGGHSYCYELLVPPSAVNRAYSLMQDDLRRYFPQYQVNVEKQVTRCLALVRLSKTDKIKSAGGEWETEVNPFGAHLRNSTLSQLLMRLRVQYLQSYRLPVVDATGYTATVDLDLEAKTYDVAELNAALAKYDLAFREQDAPAELLTIRDNQSNTSKP